MADELRTIYIQRMAPGSPGPRRQIYDDDVRFWSKLTFPATCRVTFGPLFPGGGSGYAGPSRSGLYLRVYKAKDHQLAVFPDVLQFRDAEVVLSTPGKNCFNEVEEVELVAEGVIAEFREA